MTQKIAKKIFEQYIQYLLNQDTDSNSDENRAAQISALHFLTNEAAFLQVLEQIESSQLITLDLNSITQDDNFQKPVLFDMLSAALPKLALGVSYSAKDNYNKPALERAILRNQHATSISALSSHIEGDSSSIKPSIKKALLCNQFNPNIQLSQEDFKLFCQLCGEQAKQLWLSSEEGELLQGTLCDVIKEKQKAGEGGPYSIYILLNSDSLSSSATIQATAVTVEMDFVNKRAVIKLINCTNIGVTRKKQLEKCLSEAVQGAADELNCAQKQKLDIMVEVSTDEEKDFSYTRTDLALYHLLKERRPPISSNSFIQAVLATNADREKLRIIILTAMLRDLSLSSEELNAEVESAIHNEFEEIKGQYRLKGDYIATFIKCLESWQSKTTNKHIAPLDLTRNGLEEAIVRNTSFTAAQTVCVEKCKFAENTKRALFDFACVMQQNDTSDLNNPPLDLSKYYDFLRTVAQDPKITSIEFKYLSKLQNNDGTTLKAVQEALWTLTNITKVVCNDVNLGNELDHFLSFYERANTLRQESFSLSEKEDLRQFQAVLGEKVTLPSDSHSSGELTLNLTYFFSSLNRGNRVESSDVILAKLALVIQKINNIINIKKVKIVGWDEVFSNLYLSPDYDPRFLALFAQLKVPSECDHDVHKYLSFSRNVLSEQEVLNPDVCIIRRTNGVSINLDDYLREDSAIKAEAFIAFINAHQPAITKISFTGSLEQHEEALKHIILGLAVVTEISINDEPVSRALKKECDAIILRNKALAFLDIYSASTQEAWQAYFRARILQSYGAEFNRVSRNPGVSFLIDGPSFAIEDGIPVASFDRIGFNEALLKCSGPFLTGLLSVADDLQSLSYFPVERLSFKISKRDCGAQSIDLAAQNQQAYQAYNIDVLNTLIAHIKSGKVILFSKLAFSLPDLAESEYYQNIISKIKELLHALQQQSYNVLDIEIKMPEKVLSEEIINDFITFYKKHSISSRLVFDEECFPYDKLDLKATYRSFRAIIESNQRQQREALFNSSALLKEEFSIEEKVEVEPAITAPEGGAILYPNFRAGAVDLDFTVEVESEAEVQIQTTSTSGDDEIFMDEKNKVMINAARPGLTLSRMVTRANIANMKSIPSFKEIYGSRLNIQQGNLFCQIMGVINMASNNSDSAPNLAQAKYFSEQLISPQDHSEFRHGVYAFTPEAFAALTEQQTLFEGGINVFNLPDGFFVTEYIDEFNNITYCLDYDFTYINPSATPLTPTYVQLFSERRHIGLSVAEEAKCFFTEAEAINEYIDKFSQNKYIDKFLQQNVIYYKKLIFILNKLDPNNKIAVKYTWILSRNDFAKQLLLLIRHSGIKSAKCLLDVITSLQKKPGGRIEPFLEHFVWAVEVDESSLIRLASPETLIALKELADLSLKSLRWWNYLVAKHFQLNFSGSSATGFRSSFLELFNGFNYFLSEIGESNLPESPEFIFEADNEIVLSCANMPVLLDRVLFILRSVKPKYRRQQLNYLSGLDFSNQGAWYAMYYCGYNFVCKEMELAPLLVTSHHGYEHFREMVDLDEQNPYEVNYQHLVNMAKKIKISAQEPRLWISLTNATVLFFRYLGRCKENINPKSLDSYRHLVAGLLKCYAAHKLSCPIFLFQQYAILAVAATGRGAKTIAEDQPVFSKFLTSLNVKKLCSIIGVAEQVLFDKLGDRSTWIAEFFTDPVISRPNLAEMAGLLHMAYHLNDADFQHFQQMLKEYACDKFWFVFTKLYDNPKAFTPGDFLDFIHQFTLSQQKQKRDHKERVEISTLLDWFTMVACLNSDLEHEAVKFVLSEKLDIWIKDPHRQDVFSTITKLNYHNLTHLDYLAVPLMIDFINLTANIPAVGGMAKFNENVELLFPNLKQPLQTEPEEKNIELARPGRFAEALLRITEYFQGGLAGLFLEPQGLAISNSYKSNDVSLPKAFEKYSDKKDYIDIEEVAKEYNISVAAISAFEGIDFTKLLDLNLDADQENIVSAVVKMITDNVSDYAADAESVGSVRERKSDVDQHRRQASSPDPWAQFITNYSELTEEQQKHIKEKYDSAMSVVKIISAFVNSGEVFTSYQDYKKSFQSYLEKEKSRISNASCADITKKCQQWFAELAKRLNKESYEKLLEGHLKSHSGAVLAALGLVDLNKENIVNRIIGLLDLLLNFTVLKMLPLSPKVITLIDNPKKLEFAAKVFGFSEGVIKEVITDLNRTISYLDTDLLTGFKLESTPSGLTGLIEAVAKALSETVMNNALIDQQTKKIFEHYAGPAPDLDYKDLAGSFSEFASYIEKLEPLLPVVNKLSSAWKEMILVCTDEAFNHTICLYNQDDKQGFLKLFTILGKFFPDVHLRDLIFNKKKGGLTRVEALIKVLNVLSKPLQLIHADLFDDQYHKDVYQVIFTAGVLIDEHSKPEQMVQFAEAVKSILSNDKISIKARVDFIKSVSNNNNQVINLQDALDFYHDLVKWQPSQSNVLIRIITGLLKNSGDLSKAELQRSLIWLKDVSKDLAAAILAIFDPENSSAEENLSELKTLIYDLRRYSDEAPGQAMSLQGLLSLLLKMHEAEKECLKTQGLEQQTGAFKRSFYSKLTDLSVEKIKKLLQLYQSPPYLSKSAVEKLLSSYDTYALEPAAMRFLFESTSDTEESLTDFDTALGNLDRDPAGQLSGSDWKEKLYYEDLQNEVPRIISELEVIVGLRSRKLLSSEQQYILAKLVYVNNLSLQYTEFSSVDLQGKYKELQDFFGENKPETEDYVRKTLELVALLRESYRRTSGKLPYLTQLLPLILAADGNAITEVKTGEGKTIITALQAMMKYTKGGIVEVATINPVLADEGWCENKIFFEFFGVESAVINEKSTLESYKQINYADLGTIALFKQRYDLSLDTRIGVKTHVILDEVDAAAFDAKSSFKFAANITGERESSNKDVFTIIYDFLHEKLLGQRLKGSELIVVFREYLRKESQTSFGVKAKINELDDETLRHFIDDAYTAYQILSKPQEAFELLVVTKEESGIPVQYCDVGVMQADGRSAPRNARYNRYVHAIIHAVIAREMTSNDKEHCKNFLPQFLQANSQIKPPVVPALRSALSQLTPNSMVMRYLQQQTGGEFFGSSGTMSGRKLTNYSAKFGLICYRIPPRKFSKMQINWKILREEKSATTSPKKRSWFNFSSSNSANVEQPVVKLPEEKRQERNNQRIRQIVETAQAVRNRGNPCLIYAPTDQFAEQVKQALISSNFWKEGGDFQVYVKEEGETQSQRKEFERDIIKKAATEKYCTISKLIKRGTDIKPDKGQLELIYAGGLLPEEEDDREMWQFIGRTARNGAAGTAHIILDEVDDFLAYNVPAPVDTQQETVLAAIADVRDKFAKAKGHSWQISNEYAQFQANLQDRYIGFMRQLKVTFVNCYKSISVNRQDTDAEWKKIQGHAWKCWAEFYKQVEMTWEPLRVKLNSDHKRGGFDVDKALKAALDELSCYAGGESWKTLTDDTLEIANKTYSQKYNVYQWQQSKKIADTFSQHKNLRGEKIAQLKQEEFKLQEKVNKLELQKATLATEMTSTNREAAVLQGILKELNEKLATVNNRRQGNTVSNIGSVFKAVKISVSRFINVQSKIQQEIKTKTQEVEKYKEQVERLTKEESRLAEELVTEKKFLEGKKSEIVSWQSGEKSNDSADMVTVPDISKTESVASEIRLELSDAPVLYANLPNIEKIFLPLAQDFQVVPGEHIKSSSTEQKKLNMYAIRQLETYTKAIFDDNNGSKQSLFQKRISHLWNECNHNFDRGIKLTPAGLYLEMTHRLALELLKTTYKMTSANNRSPLSIAAAKRVYWELIETVRMFGGNLEKEALYEAHADFYTEVFKYKRFGDQAPVVRATIVREMLDFSERGVFPEGKIITPEALIKTAENTVFNSAVSTDSRQNLAGYDAVLEDILNYAQQQVNAYQRAWWKSSDRRTNLANLQEAICELRAPGGQAEKKVVTFIQKVDELRAELVADDQMADNKRQNKLFSRSLRNTSHGSRFQGMLARIRQRALGGMYNYGALFDTQVGFIQKVISELSKYQGISVYSNESDFFTVLQEFETGDSQLTSFENLLLLKDQLINKLSTSSPQSNQRGFYRAIKSLIEQIYNFETAISISDLHVLSCSTSVLARKATHEIAGKIPLARGMGSGLQDNFKLYVKDRYQTVEHVNLVELEDCERADELLYRLEKQLLKANNVERFVADSISLEGCRTLTVKYHMLQLAIDKGQGEHKSQSYILTVQGFGCRVIPVCQNVMTESESQLQAPLCTTSAKLDESISVAAKTNEQPQALLFKMLCRLQDYGVTIPPGKSYKEIILQLFGGSCAQTNLSILAKIRSETEFKDLDSVLEQGAPEIHELVKASKAIDMPLQTHLSSFSSEVSTAALLEVLPVVDEAIESDSTSDDKPLSLVGANPPDTQISIAANARHSVAGGSGRFRLFREDGCRKSGNSSVAQEPPPQLVI